MSNRRLERVREWMAGRELEALVVTSPPNLRYLTGFAGEGVLVVAGEPLICTDSRYRVQAAEEAPGVRCIADGNHLAQAVEHLREIGARRIGFESHHLTFADYQSLAEKLEGAELVPCEDEIKRMRAVKDAGEVALIRQAATIADEAFVQWRRQLQIGISEREAALELERMMVLSGAEGASFEIIVAAGPNGAKPHARPDRRTINEGELVVVDWGAVVEGYRSDCTRTLVMGEPDAKQHEIWQAVRASQLAALDAVRPGAKCADIDAIARSWLDERGWGQHFGHGLGHGVGLEVHERPAVSQRSQEVLEPGMVVTIEPGVYLEGWGGVRLEELVLVTETGAEVLTKAPYDL